MRVGILGINHKLADLELREMLAKTCQRRLAPGYSNHNDHYFVLLSTCNRTEIYFSSDDLTATHSYLLNILRQNACEDFDQKLYSYFGQDCLMHLCRVTAGLDSAIIAETEIQGQVKNAYEKTQEHHHLPYELHYLFQKSLGIGKKARAVMPVKPGLPDIEHAVLQTGHYFFKTKVPRILFIGASGINEKILTHFKSKNFGQLTLCNRSEEKGRQMAKTNGISFLEWENKACWNSFDWLIFGTKSSDFLLTPEFGRENFPSDKLIIDLCVPRNVHPHLARHPNITLLNIDQINRRLTIRRKKMHFSLVHAEEIVFQSITQQIKLFHQKEQKRLVFCEISA